MNFLEIAKRVSKECGISGDGPNSVAAQTGMNAKVVNWVRDAFNEIQGANEEWDFDWAMTTQVLVAGKERYDPIGDWGLEHKSFLKRGTYVYRTVDGPHAKHWPEFIGWQDFRELRLPDVRGIPVYASVAPDGSLYLYPIPDDGITAVVEYFREPQVLTSNLDVPRLPARYHMAIVWRAVMFFCASEENPTLFQSASQNFRNIMRRLSVLELPDIEMAEPLA